MRPLSECRLYTFLDSGYIAPGDFAKTAHALCQGGSDLIQLRLKGFPLSEARRVANEIAPILRDYGTGLVINDHLELAQEMDADFVHLGQEDFFDAGFQSVSELRGPGKLKAGLSTHGVSQAERAVKAGADYVAIGPIYSTPTKPTAAAVTLQYVRWAAQNISIPWFSIGGIQLQNLDEVLASGARRICVVSAILKAPDIADACHEFKKRIISAEH
ncbi:MAG: thiamine biosynthesis protein ThiS [Verrucomicrobiales bacterium]|nr:thiamine biosynthesis protein ThiS [Verrucomicrobiales bacterium]